MSAPVRILGLGGSIRKGSVNKLVLEMMLELAREFGAETDIADVHTMNLPIFNQDIPREQQPEQLLWLIERIALPIAALLMIAPEPVSTAVGFSILAAVTARQYLGSRDTSATLAP